MRRWLATLVGTAAVAVAGTAVALTGPGLVEEPEAKAPIEVDEEVTPVITEPVVAEEVTFDRVEEYVLPEIKHLDEEVEKKEETPDETPPEIEILHPSEGQVFETKEVVFEGKSEPGARVFAGDYEADVNGEGQWRIVLYLGKGRNVVTLKALDAAGNTGSDSVTVFFDPPETPKEEPRKEEPRKEEPKEEPKEEQPQEEPHEWEFVAMQVYGECNESPPYDVFHGKGKPGTKIHVGSEYGSAVAEVGEKGGWEVKVVFETAPVGEVFVVKVQDEFGNYKKFEFVRTG